MANTTHWLPKASLKSFINCGFLNAAVFTETLSAPFCNNKATSSTEWAREAVALGAGEILLTSMNNDGTKNGFALDITAILANGLSVPVIASGGAGTMEHFKEVFENANADAALAASIFHYKEVEITSLKKYLNKKKISIRL